MVRKLIIAVVALVALAATPASAQYPEIVVQPGRVGPGGTVTVTGKGCDAGVTVTITMRRVPAGGQASLPAGGAGDGRVAAPVRSGSPLRGADLDVGEVVATTTTDQDGTFTATFTVPPHATPGFYDVISQCGDHVLSQRIEVVGASQLPDDGGSGNNGGGSGIRDTGRDGALPRTGSNLNAVGLLGAALLVAGGLVLLAARKRQHATA